MTRIPGRSAAAPLITVSLIMRMFWGLTISHSYALNAIWLCPLLGIVLFLPFKFAVDQISALDNGSPWENLRKRVPPSLLKLSAILFGVLLLQDAAITARLAADSTNIIALNEVTAQILVLPMGVVAFLVVWFGAEATGNSSRLWLRIFTLLSTLIFFVQIRSCNLGWLTPILGAGVGSILQGGIYCGSCMVLLSLVWLVAEPDRFRHGLLYPVAWATFICTGLLLIQQMLAPALPLPTFNRAERIELILGNGRLSLSPQIILDILWYGNLLHLMSAEATTASLLIQKIFPKLPVWVLGLICACSLTIVAVMNFASDTLTVYIFPVASSILALLMLLSLPAKEAQAKCEE